MQLRAADAVDVAGVNWPPRRLFAFLVDLLPLDLVAGDSPAVVASALVPVTAGDLVAVLGSSQGCSPQRTGPAATERALLSPVRAVAAVLAVGIGSHALLWDGCTPGGRNRVSGLWPGLSPPPLTASAMNSAPDSQAGLASGVNNAVARVAGLLWIAALPPITGLTGAVYTDPVRFRSSFGHISWICAAAFTSGAALAATFITRPEPHHPAAAGAHPNTGAPPRLPSRHPPGVGINPQANDNRKRPMPASGRAGHSP